MHTFFLNFSNVQIAVQNCIEVALFCSLPSSVMQAIPQLSILPNEIVFINKYTLEVESSHSHQITIFILVVRTLQMSIYIVL